MAIFNSYVKLPEGKGWIEKGRWVKMNQLDPSLTENSQKELVNTQLQLLIWADSHVSVVTSQVATFHEAHPGRVDNGY